MKTIISILVLVLGTVSIFKTNADKEDQRTCICFGSFCACDVTCPEDEGLAICSCGTFSCICKCMLLDASNAKPSLPTMNTDQQSNSTKGEKYFKELNTPGAITIADGIKNLREAILTSDLQRYQSSSKVVEEAYSGFSASQKSAWEIWAAQNLKK